MQGVVVIHTITILQLVINLCILSVQVEIMSLWVLTAMYGGVGAANQVAIGTEALYSATSGLGNVAVGHRTAKALGSGENENIAIGYHTMYLMDEGSGANVDENIAIGSFAMQGKDLGSASTDITRNIAIGKEALQLSNGTSSFGQHANGL